MSQCKQWYHLIYAANSQSARGEYPGYALLSRAFLDTATTIQDRRSSLYKSHCHCADIIPAGYRSQPDLSPRPGSCLSIRCSRTNNEDKDLELLAWIGSRLKPAKENRYCDYIKRIDQATCKKKTR